MQKDYIKELQIIFFSDLAQEEKKGRILQYHYSDIARLIETLDRDFHEQILSYFTDDELLCILDYLTSIDLIEAFGLPKTIFLLEKMEPCRASAFLSEMNPTQKMEVLSQIKSDVKEQILKLNQYDGHRLVGMMTQKYISVFSTDTVEDSLKKIENSVELQTISLIYVVDIHKKLLGVVPIEELPKVSGQSLMQEIMKKNYPVFLYSDGIEQCMEDFKQYGLDTYPIVDEQGKLLGIISSRKIIELIEKAMADNYAKLAGLTEEEKNYHSTFDSVKRRLPWLIILLVLGLFQAFAMTAFEHLVVSLPVLIFFQTFLLSLSGGTGTQTLAMTLQNLNQKVTLKKGFFKSAYKELKLGFFNGLAIGILAFIIIFVFMFVTKLSVGTEVYYVQDAIKVSAVLSFSLWLSVIASSIVGVVMPYLFLKLRMKPTTASGILIQILCDAVALLIYYGIAYYAFL